MQHLTIAILVIILSASIYISSWKLMIKDRYKISVWLLILAGLIIRLWIAADPFLHEWDERYNALVAKHLAGNFLLPTLYENPVLPYDYTDWQANHIWLHKQPMALWLIAISIKIFGTSEIAVRLLSIVMSTVGIWLVYDIGRHLYKARTGYIAALLFSLNGFIIALAAGRIHTDHIDSTFLFFILLSVWFCMRYVQKGSWYFNILAGVFLGCAVLTKWLTAYIVLPVWLLLVLFKRKDSYTKTLANMAVIVVVSVMVFLPWQLYILQSFPQEAQWEYKYNNVHLYEAVEGHEGGPLYHFKWLATIYGVLVYFSIAWFAIRTIKRKNIADLTLMTWFGIPYLFFTLVATKMPAYPLIAAPAIFLMMAESVIYLFDRAEKLPKYKPVILFFAFGIIIASAKYTLERIKPIAIENREPAWATDIKALRNTQVDSDKYILFNTEHYIETMFYLNCIAYPHIPDSATIEKLKAQGYQIVVNSSTH